MAKIETKNPAFVNFIPLDYIFFIGFVSSIALAIYFNKKSYWNLQ
jgi:hypothetical protein